MERKDPKELKKAITFRFAPKLIERLEKAAHSTGLKMNTIVEQGTEKRLTEIEKAKR